MTENAEQQISMVQECASKYEVTELPNGGAEIRISVTPSYKILWLTKLSDLRTTVREIDEYSRP
jgi:hypothetical protein